MNDKLTTLSFSIHSNKGVYALLLGSGISKSAAIPTGWDIVLDLINKLCVTLKEDCSSDPVAWFLEKYQEDPNYSTILGKLAISQPERMNLLNGYFERSNEDKESGLKLPTNAHKSIAKLVSKGYIKVIITTNFDRLLEKALQDEGVEPNVIRHVDDLSGTLPLVHSKFTLIKVNGDYLDSRLLNTREELSEYPSELQSYLLSIINDFGLISCGWSGKWDNGLVNIINKSENFRYPSYFSFIGKCEQELSDIATSRKGSILEINSADEFFNELSERIEALNTFNSNHPLNKDIAISRLKKYIVRDDGIILYRDLLMNECRSALKKGVDISVISKSLNKELFDSYFLKQKNALEILIPLCITTIQWSKSEHEQTILDIMNKFTQSPIRVETSFFPNTVKTHYLSSLLMLYVIGISSVMYNKYTLLNKVFKLLIPQINKVNGEKSHLIQEVNPDLIDSDILNSILGPRYKTPTSMFLSKELRDYFSQIIENEDEFNAIFDTFEYLLSLNYLDIVGPYRRTTYVPYGNYQWKHYSKNHDSNDFYSLFFKRADIEKLEWQPIKDGMFGGSHETYVDIKCQVDDYLKTIFLY